MKNPPFVPASSALNDLDLLWLQSQSGLSSPVGSSSSSLASSSSQSVGSSAAGPAALAAGSDDQQHVLNKMTLHRWNQQQLQQDQREMDVVGAKCGPIQLMPETSLINLHRRVERTQSEPNRASMLSVNTSRYKTELCRPYEENGFCKYGDKCQFAHGEQDLRTLSRHPKYKTELCRTYHTDGICPYGSRCHFIHSDEIRNYTLKSMGKHQRPHPLVLNRSSSVCSSPPSSLGSGSPTALSANTAFSFASPVRSLSPLDDAQSPPPRPSSPRLPVFNEISPSELECLIRLTEHFNLNR